MIFQSIVLGQSIDKDHQSAAAAVDMILTTSSILALFRILFHFTFSFLLFLLVYFSSEVSEKSERRCKDVGCWMRTRTRTRAGKKGGGGKGMEKGACYFTWLIAFICICI